MPRNRLLYSPHPLRWRAPKRSPMFSFMKYALERPEEALLLIMKDGRIHERTLPVDGD